MGSRIVLLDEVIGETPDEGHLIDFEPEDHHYPIWMCSEEGKAVEVSHPTAFSVCPFCGETVENTDTVNHHNPSTGDDME